MKKRRAVYPGTFDPVHYGHLDLMHRACAIFDELVVAVFDHGQPSKTILFSVNERVSDEGLPGDSPAGLRLKVEGRHRGPRKFSARDVALRVGARHYVKNAT